MRSLPLFKSVNNLSSDDQARQAVIIVAVNFYIVSYPGSSARVFSGFHLQTPNTCGLENSHGPSFPCDFRQSVQYIHFQGGERKRYHKLHRMIQHQILWLSCALSCSDPAERCCGPCGEGPPEGTWTSLHDSVNKMAKCFLNLFWVQTLTRLLSQGISFNPIQCHSATNYGPWSIGRENKVRLSKRLAQAHAGRRDMRRADTQQVSGSGHRPSRLERNVLQSPVHTKETRPQSCLSLSWERCPFTRDVSHSYSSVPVHYPHRLLTRRDSRFTVACGLGIFLEVMGKM